MCLAEAVNTQEHLDRAYIVLGGTGWTKDEFFLNDLADWVNNDAHVKVLRLEEFVAMANHGNSRTYSKSDIQIKFHHPRVESIGVEEFVRLVQFHE